MSASNINLAKINSKELNRDIEHLITSTDDDCLKKCLIGAITREIRIATLKKWFKILLLIAFVVSQIYVIPFLNWNASAIGRIVMIKMLKVWDWRYFYNLDCLIERKLDTSDHMENSIASIEDDCSFCETIGNFFKQNQNFLQSTRGISSYFRRNSS